MTPLFTATIEPGKLSFVGLQMERDFGGYLHTLEGRRVTVTVEKEKRKRSNPLNRYYWGVVLQLIAEHTGEDPENPRNAESPLRPEARCR